MQLREVPERFVVCVSVDGIDAGAAFLSSLKDTGRTIVPASKCTWVLDVDKGSYYRDPATKAFFVDVTSNAEDSEVEYTGRHHGRWAIFRTIAVAKKNGEWIVVRVIRHAEA